MGSNRDKQRLVDSVYVLIVEQYWKTEIMLISTLKISFSEKNFAPPPESFAPENLEGTPPEKFLAAPP